MGDLIIAASVLLGAALAAAHLRTMRALSLMLTRAPAAAAIDRPAAPPPGPGFAPGHTGLASALLAVALLRLLPVAGALAVLAFAGPAPAIALLAGFLAARTLLLVIARRATP